MRLRDLLLTAGAVAGVTGCASGARQTVTSDEPPQIQWVGSLQPTQQRTGQLAVTGQTRAFGTVTIVPARGGNMERMHVTLTVSVPITNTTGLRWAIIPERCGSGELPLIGVDQFPLIEISSNGRGTVQADLPLPLVPNNAYHVDVYNGNAQPENVITCGNLKYDSGR